MADKPQPVFPARMHEYVRRMEELIHAAYAEGFVLTTEGGRPEDRATLLPPPDGMGFYKVINRLGQRGHMHLCLAKPVAVVATAVVRPGPNNEPLELMPTVPQP